MSSFTRFSSQLDLRYHSESVWEVLTPFSYDVSELGSGITVDIPKGFKMRFEDGVDLDMDKDDIRRMILKYANV